MPISGDYTDHDFYSMYGMDIHDAALQGDGYAIHMLNLRQLKADGTKRLMWGLLTLFKEVVDVHGTQLHVETVIKHMVAQHNTAATKGTTLVAPTYASPLDNFNTKELASKVVAVFEKATKFSSMSESLDEVLPRMLALSRKGNN